MNHLLCGGESSIWDSVKINEDRQKTRIANLLETEYFLFL